MTQTRLLPFFFIGLCWALPTIGQNWDFQSWYRVKVNGELVKDLSLSVEQQVRLFDNSLKLDQTFTELGLGYELPKGFDIALAYRFSWNPNQDGTLSNRHRYNVDLSYGRKLWKFRGKIRARIQHRPSSYLLNERLEPEDSPVYLRLKGSIDYRKLGDWTPGIAFEAFFRLENPNQMGANKFRYRVFLDYDLPKRNELGLFYMLETDYSGRTPAYFSILGLSYAYQWKRPKKKKKKDKN